MLPFAAGHFCIFWMFILGYVGLFCEQLNIFHGILHKYSYYYYDSQKGRKIYDVLPRLWGHFEVAMSPIWIQSSMP